MKDHLKKQLLVSLLLVLALLMCACGGNTSPSESANAGQSAAQPATTKKAATAAAPTTATKKAVTPAAFKAALEAVGYLEESELDAKYGDVYAAMEDGVTGYMFDDDDIGDPAGLRQYLFFEMYDLASGIGGISYFIIFDSESSANEYYNSIKGSIASYADVDELIGESYTKLIVKYDIEGIYDDFEGIMVKDGKTVIVLSIPSVGLSAQVIEILGY